MFLITMGSNAPSPLYVIYQHRFHFSALALTWVFASYAVAVMVALVTVGHLSDVIGRRRVLAPSVLLLGVSAALFASAHGIGSLVAARAVQGLATGGVTGAATAALVELEPRQDRQRASYINTIVFIVGAASGPLMFGLFAQYLPWPLVLPYLVEAALAMVGLYAVWRLPETVVAGPGARWSLQRPSVPRSILGPFVVAVLALTVSWAVGALFAALSSTIDRQLLHLTNHASAGFVLFVFYGVGGLSQLSARRWPPHRSMILGTATTAAGMALVYASLVWRDVPAFLVGTLLAGAGAGVAFLGSLALVNHVAPAHRRAEIVSAWNLVGYVALSAPVVGVGVLTGVTGLQSATGIFTAAVVATSLVTLVAVAASQRRRLTP